MTLTNHHSESEVNQLFSRVAPQYDRMNDLISLGTQRRWRKQLFRELPIHQGDTCLDLCCGTGDLTISLAQRSGRKGRVVGLDFNAEMLALAKQKALTRGVNQQIEWLQADAMHLPFTDDQFNMITIGYGLRNVPDANQVLSEIYRVLAPGGHFACLEMSQPTNPIIKLGWRAYFKLFPYMARLTGAHPQDYQYLQKTAQAFYSADELVQVMRESGFQKVSYHKLNLGAGALHFGQKARIN